MPPSTASTGDILRAVRLRMLTFVPQDGSPILAQRLSGGLHLVAPSDDAVEPYQVIRISDIRSRRSQPGRVTAECESQLFHRPRSSVIDLEDIADVGDQAMLRWTEVTDGLIACVGWRRQTPPPLSEGDPELVRIRTVYDLVIYPAYLTQYLAP